MRRLRYTGPGAVLVERESPARRAIRPAHRQARAAARCVSAPPSARSIRVRSSRSRVGRVCVFVDARAGTRPTKSSLLDARAGTRRAESGLRRAEVVDGHASDSASAGPAMTLRPPISFVYGNVLFGRTLDDGWAAFAVQTSSYQWLSEDGKRARLLELLGAIEAVEADLQIVRVSRTWQLESYVAELEGARCPEVRSPSSPISVTAARGVATSRTASRAEGRTEMGAVIKTESDQNENAHARTRVRRQYLQEHARRLTDIGQARPVVFLIVSLQEPARDIAAYVSKAAESAPRHWLGALRRAFSARERAMLTARARAGTRQGRSVPRAAGRLPARQAGPGRRAAVAHQARVLPRSRGARGQRPARAQSTRVRAQRRGAAGAAGG